MSCVGLKNLQSLAKKRQAENQNHFLVNGYSPSLLSLICKALSTVQGIHSILSWPRNIILGFFNWNKSKFQLPLSAPKCIKEKITPENPQVVLSIVRVFVEGFVPGLDCHMVAAVFNPILE